jgi:hypothetical protein
VEKSKAEHSPEMGFGAGKQYSAGSEPGWHLRVSWSVRRDDESAVIRFLHYVSPCSSKVRKGFGTLKYSQYISIRQVFENRYLNWVGVEQNT